MKTQTIIYGAAGLIAAYFIFGRKENTAPPVLPIPTPTPTNESAPTLYQGTLNTANLTAAQDIGPKYGVLTDNIGVTMPHTVILPYGQRASYYCMKNPNDPKCKEPMANITNKVMG